MAHDDSCLFRITRLLCSLVTCCSGTNAQIPPGVSPGHVRRNPIVPSTRPVPTRRGAFPEFGFGQVPHVSTPHLSFVHRAASTANKDESNNRTRLLDQRTELREERRVAHHSLTDEHRVRPSVAQAPAILGHLDAALGDEGGSGEARYGMLEGTEVHRKIAEVAVVGAYEPGARLQREIYVGMRRLLGITILA